MRARALDLKADEGKAAFLRLAEARRRRDRELPARRGRPPRHRLRGRARRSIPGSSTARPSGYGQDGPRAQWAGHDLNYLAVGGYLDCSGRTPEGGPALPGATIADARAAACRPSWRSWPPSSSASPPARASTSTWRSPTACSPSCRSTSTSTWPPATSPVPGHDLLTGRYACYDVYEAADGGWLSVGAIEPHFWANLCRAAGPASSWPPTRPTTPPGRDPRRLPGRLRHAKTATSGSTELGPADTCVAPVLTIAEVAADDQYAARGAVVDATHPTEGAFRQVGPVLAGQPGAGEAVTVPDWAETSTVEILTAAGYAPADARVPAGRRRDRMTTTVVLAPHCGVPAPQSGARTRTASNWRLIAAFPRLNRAPERVAGGVA